MSGIKRRQAGLRACTPLVLKTDYIRPLSLIRSVMFWL